MTEDNPVKSLSQVYQDMGWWWFAGGGWGSGLIEKETSKVRATLKQETGGGVAAR